MRIRILRLLIGVLLPFSTFIGPGREEGGGCKAKIKLLVGAKPALVEWGGEGVVQKPAPFLYSPTLKGMSTVRFGDKTKKSNPNHPSILLTGKKGGREEGRKGKPQNGGQQRMLLGWGKKESNVPGGGKRPEGSLVS